MNKSLILALTAILLVSSCNTLPGALRHPAPPSDATVFPEPVTYPDIGIDESVFLTDVQKQTTYLVCKNEASGPYYRLQSDPAKTGKINFAEGEVFLPAAKATSQYVPYLYLGGQPRTGSAADAGVYLEPKTDMYNPFINVSLKNGDGQNGHMTQNLDRETIDKKLYTYRLFPDQNIQMRMSIPQDGQMRLDVTGRWARYEILSTGGLKFAGDVGDSTRTVLHQQARGWRKDGTDQVIKVMTTIAYHDQGFEYSTADFQFSGSSWSGLKVGLINNKGADTNVKTFNTGIMYSNCAKPEDIVSFSPESALPEMSAVLKLRTQARLKIDPTSFQLKARLREDVKDHFDVMNQGPENALLHFQVTPLGRPSPIKGKINSGKEQRVEFVATCGSIPGKQAQKKMQVLYSIGETYVKGHQNALENAEFGDLLYRKAPVTVDLTCQGEKLIHLVIDDTGSMSPVLGAVTGSLASFINSTPDDEDYQWMLTTFKDDVTFRGSTTDKSTILSMVNGLYAWGGDDCPENALGALGSAVASYSAAPEGDRQIVFATDASAGSGDPDAVIADAKAAGVKVNVLLSGSGCGYGVGAAMASRLSIKTGQPIPAETGISRQALTLPADLKIFERIAQETGGKFYYLPYAPQNAFEDALTEIFQSIADGDPGSTDDVPPVVQVSVNPAVLWTPNNKMIEITPTVSATDNTDPQPEISLVDITTEDPTATPEDIQRTADGRLYVRATRAGSSTGRVYTITYRAVDDAGNTGLGQATVTVPHDQGQ